MGGGALSACRKWRWDPLSGGVAVAGDETKCRELSGEAGTTVRGRERPWGPVAEGLKEERLCGYKH